MMKLKIGWLTAFYPGDFTPGPGGTFSWEFTGGIEKGKSVMLSVTNKMSFVDLYDTMVKLLKIDASQYELVLRCHNLVGAEYPPVVIEDDSSVVAMMTCWKPPRVYVTLKEKFVDVGNINDGEHYMICDHEVVAGQTSFSVNDDLGSFIAPVNDDVEILEARVDADVRIDVGETLRALVSGGVEDTNLNSSFTVTDKIESLESVVNINTGSLEALVDAGVTIDVGEKLLASNGVNGVNDDIVVFEDIHELGTRGGVGVSAVSLERIPDIEDVHVKDRFKSKAHLLEKLTHLAFKYDFEYKTERSNKTLCVLVCFQKECKWRVRATSEGDSECFIIRIYNDKHTCPLSLFKADHRQATSQMIGNLFAWKLLDRKRSIRTREIMKDVEQEFGINVSYSKAYYGLRRARILARGDPSKSFAELPKFFHSLKITNPGTMTSIKTIETIKTIKTKDKETKEVVEKEVVQHAFLYCFMALGASIEGFKSSIRKVISVDGTFLTSTYKGTLLVATCQDGNYQLYPLAFGVVDSENGESWTWFFEKLKEITGGEEEMLEESPRKRPRFGSLVKLLKVKG